MAPMLIISISCVGITKIPKRIEGFSSSSNDLLALIEVLLSQQEGAENDVDIFSIILMSMQAANSLVPQDTGEDNANPASLPSSEASYFAQPSWSVSLLYWATHCAVQSAEVQEFRSRLETEGALMDEPCLSELLVSKYESTNLQSIFSKTLSGQERTQFTGAWMQSFPKYTIPLFPRAINVVLSILQDGGFFRDGGPLSADELVRLSGILTDAISFHMGPPNFNTLLHTIERLHDAGLMSSDGLVTVSQVLRTGRIYWEHGLITKESLFSGQPFLTAGVKDDDIRYKAAVLRGYKLFVDNGWIHTACEVPSKVTTGAGEESLDFTAEAFSLPDLLRNNGIDIFEMMGPLKDCKVM